MKRFKRRLAVVAIFGGVLTAGVLAFGGGPARSSVLHPLTVTIIHQSGSCTWGVHKTATDGHGNAISHLTLAVNESATINYTVTVSESCTYDVTGTISGDADHGGVPTSVSVSAGGVNGTVSGCTSDGTTFTCNFDVAPTSPSGTINANATYSDSSTSSGSAPFGPITPSEATVDVNDTFAGSLATHLNHPATFHYTRTISFDHCGHFTVDNTATVVDGTTLASSSVSILVDVPCANGCTLTPGYWKTHSKYGPAPTDPAWASAPFGGPDATFFKSGASYITVINTPPSGGNAYYILSFQYIAAVLNISNGASAPSSVTSAITQAAALFNTYTPAQIGALKGGDALRQQFISLAGILGDYNSGVIGPGHCDDTSTS